MEQEEMGKETRKTKNKKAKRITKGEYTQFY